MPHQHLLLKLETIGITGNLLKWISVFLISCSQRVVINGKFSDWLPVLSGVPQGGSILGPLLFILYINDITFVVLLTMSPFMLKYLHRKIALSSKMICPTFTTGLFVDN